MLQSKVFDVCLHAEFIEFFGCVYFRLSTSLCTPRDFGSKIQSLFDLSFLSQYIA